MSRGRGVLAVAGWAGLAAAVASLVVALLVSGLAAAANLGQVEGLVLGLPTLVVALCQWSRRRNPASALPSDGVDLAAVRERDAADRLAEFLGRNAALPCLGDKPAGPIALGVHQAIETPGAAQAGLNPLLPLYVEREAAGQVRDWLEHARVEGGFVPWVGDSSVGKTRLLYETALRRATWPSCWPLRLARRRGRRSA